MLKVENFNLSFKGRTLYQDAELNLQGPGLYVLVAKNGTGKTVFFKALTGSIPAEFDLSLDGYSHKESLERISYVDVENNLFDSLTLMENLKLFTKDLDLIEKYLERFKLQDRKKIKCKKLSAGERQRAAIILGILEGQPVLLLDEPISHLDKETAKLILDNLKILSEEKYILFSTHRFSDYEGIDAAFAIENHTFHLITEPMAQSIERYPKEEPVTINKRVLSKIVFWKPNLIASLLLSFLCAVFLLSFASKELSKEDIYLKLLQSSIHDPYLIDTYWSDSTFDKENRLPMSDISGYKDELKQGNPVVLSLDFLQVGDFNYDLVSEEYKNAFLVQSFFNAYVITNRFLDIDLEDNEMILSDYMYDRLKEYQVIEESGNLEWLSLFETKIYIKYVFPTQYSYWQSLSIEEEIDPREMVEYLNEYNYIYHRCYLNETTYNTLKEKYYAKCQTLAFWHRSQKITLGICEQTFLFQGRLPEKENETVVSKRYYRLLFGDSTEFDQESSVSMILEGSEEQVSRMFRSNKTVVGILEDDQSGDLLFYNQSVLNDYFDTGYSHIDTWSYSPKDLSEKDIKQFDSCGLLLASEYDYAVYSCYQNYEKSQRVLFVIFGISIGLMTTFYLLSTGFYVALKRKSFKLLQVKKKSKRAFLHMLFTSAFLNILIGAVVFFVTVFFLCGNVFNPYLKGSLGIPLVVLNVHLGISFSVFFVFSVLLLLKYGLSYRV